MDVTFLAGRILCSRRAASVCLCMVAFGTGANCVWTASVRYNRTRAIGLKKYRAIVPATLKICKG